MSKIIEDGVIVKKHNGFKEILKYNMMFLDEAYMDDVLRLQEEVFRNLDNTETFVPDTKEFIEKEILPKHQGRMMGIFTKDGLIAYRTINFPGSDEKNLGREIDLCKEKLDKVAHLESTVVHPNYRGNRLQAKMLCHSIKLIRELGYDYILSTISPYNYPSLKNVMEYGLTIKDLKARDGVYEGKLRYLLYIDFINTQREVKDRITVKNIDIIKQQRLIKEGYEGCEIKKQERYFDILYCKY